MRHDYARKCGVPKWLRQYNARYGQGGVSELVKTHMKNPGPMLDHWAVRKEAARKLFALIHGANRI